MIQVILRAGSACGVSFAATASRMHTGDSEQSFGRFSIAIAFDETVSYRSRRLNAYRNILSAAC